MSKYLATINTPGYLPQDDDPPTFDTAREAWAYLADEREREEDNYPGWPWEPHGPETGEYSDTLDTLRFLASEGGQAAYGDPYTFWGINIDGTGSVYGSTPGRAEDDDRDLGQAYTVSIHKEDM